MKLIRRKYISISEVISLSYNYNINLEGMKTQFSFSTQEKSKKKVTEYQVTAINFNSTSNSMIDAEFEFFEVSILIEYLFVPYRSSNSMSN